MSSRSRRRLKILHSVDEIPLFKNEDEEHEFWATHGLSEELLARARWEPDDPYPPPQPEATPRRAKAGP